MLDDQAAFLIEVARLTYDRLPDFRMLLVGGNPDVLDRLRARVNAAGLGGQVLLPGFVDPARVSVYQSAADVLIFHMDSDLSHFEYCTPAKGFDYQATGRPIVARDIPLFDEVFGAGEERAIRVMEPTPERFAVAIAHALDLEDGGRAMTERARTWVAGRSWQGRAEAVLDSLYPRP
jgi:glycosyltransferase involved in cell wall biosynthesis